MSCLQSRANAAGVGEPLSSDECETLRAQLVKGDKPAREKLIVGNMALANWAVERYLRMMPEFRYLREDMLSEGLLAIVQQVDRLATLPIPSEPNVLGYISLGIQRAIGHFLDCEGTIVVPSSVVREGRKSGDKLKKPCVIQDFKFEILETADPMRVVELRELIFSCAENDQQRQILELAEKRHTNKEIAEITGLPLSTAWLWRKEMYARFLEKSGMKGVA